MRANVLGIAAGAALWALSFAYSPSASSQERLTLLLDFSPWGMHAATHLATERGWFEEEGLSVDISDGRGSVSTIQLVGAGQAEVGMAQLGSMAAARHSGDLSLKAIAAWVRRGDLGVLVDEDSDVEEVADLEGKRLVLFAASPWVPFLDMFFESGGLTVDDVDLLYVDPAAMMGTYTSGQADGVMTAGPFGQAVAEAVRPTKLILLDDQGISFPSYGFFAMEETIAEKGDALRKLLKVHQRALDYIYSGNIDEGVEAIINQRPDAKLDPTVLRRHLELYAEFLDTPHTEGRPYGWQAEEDWSAAVTTMQEAGLLPSDAQPADFYTNELIGD